MNSSEIILYTTPDGNVKVEVILQDETVLLTQKTMGELFGVETNTINYHLKEVFKTNELEKDSVIRKIRITAAEIISSRAKAELPNMGLTTWKNSPKGKVLKSDVSVAKNYLNQKEIEELNRIVTMYLDYAENQAARQIPMKMKDWIGKLDGFLQFNDYSVLKNAGSISADIAKKLATEEFEKFRVKQDSEFESDFDREVKRLKGDDK